LLLIDAARELVAQGIRFELVLAGDGEMRHVIEERVRRHDMESVVRITGWLSGEAVKTEILHASALVLPSFAEGLPVVLMEAMALERPVLTTWVAGIPELVTHRETGWLFPAGDISALVTALRELFRTAPDRLTEMGKAGRQRVQARHDISGEVAKLLAHVAASQEQGLRHG
jgi:colanic acid/amylovoran biosynthesis glycosyltransferase